MAPPRFTAGPLDAGRLGMIALQTAGVVVVLVVWAAVLGTDWPKVALGAVVLGWFLVGVARRRHDLRALVVDARGVRIRRALVPWPDVREVALLRSGDRGPAPEVGLVLRPGARLPAGLTALVRDPDPDAVPASLRLPTAGWALDVDRLGSAVRAHGGGVPLVERWGSARRVLP